MSVELQITQLSSAAVPQAAEVQGRAFFDDPAFAFVFLDENTRLQRLTWLMGIGVAYGCRFGSVSTTGDPMLGHAVWLPPGATSISHAQMDEVGFGEAPTRMGEDALGRFGAFMELMSMHHERIAPMPHWYLLILGVEPEHQGKGIGSSLIAPGLTRADAASLPCYLETRRSATWRSIDDTASRFVMRITSPATDRKSG
jgi:GNAT superfamily N-acetyltransferase